MPPKPRERSSDRRLQDWATLLYVAAIPFDIIPVAFGRTLTGPLALLLFATWSINSHRRAERINFPASAGVLLFLYCWWIIFTVYWSVDPTAAISSLQAFLLQAPLVVVLSNALGHVWFRSLITLGCSTGVVGLVVLTRPANPLRSGRAGLEGIDENVTALVLVVGLAALIYVATHLSGRQAALVGPIVVVIVLATLRTGSRSGAIAAAAVLVMAVLHLIQQGRVRPVLWFRTAGIVLLIGFSAVMALRAGMLPQRVVELLSPSTVPDSGRSEIIDLFQKTFEDWVFFGVGSGNDSQYLSVTESVTRNAHSLFWKTWIETGLVGLTLFAAFLAVVVKRGVRSVASQALTLLAVPIVLFAITLGGATTSVFWFVIALALTTSPTEFRTVEVGQSKVDLSRG